MRARLKNFFLGLIGLGIVIALIAGAALLFVYAINKGSTFGAASIAALATVAAAVLVRDFERRRVMDAIRREHLSKIYIEMAQVLHGRSVPQRKQEELILNFMRKGLVYASPATLKAFRNWQVNLPPSDQEWPDEVQVPNSLRYEAFVKAMRKDLGISNWGLGDGDLARLGINDYDDYVEAMNAAKHRKEPQGEESLQDAQAKDREV